ncbi:MAG: hypothetical protein HY898_16490 [Deltaproteobacteria bacterium]|nr:hypothetical protein [Deltaproteobacteria bacterium]
MTHRCRIVASGLAVIFPLALLGACSSSDSSAPPATGGTGGAGGAGGTGGTGGTGGAGGTGGGAGAGEDAATDVTAEAAIEASPESATDGPVNEAEASAPVSSCSEIAGSKDCFANKDCPADRKCANAGTETNPVPCCVVGARGTGAAGQTCAGENDCESGVCIAGSGPYMCSKDCTSAADCPDGMKDCKEIAFSGSADKWCFPTN